MLRVASIVAAILLSQVPAPPSGPAPAGTATVAGRAIDALTNRPVSNVIVTLIQRPSQTAPPQPGVTSGAIGGTAAAPVSVLTDAQGRFVFKALKTGTYEVRAEKRGYVPGAIGKLRPDGTTSSVILTDAQQVSDVAIRLWKHASIAGGVLDEAGEPAVGVFVHVLRRESGSRQFASVASGTTDDRGAFRIGSLLAGEYVLAVPSVIATVPDGMQNLEGAGGINTRGAGTADTMRVDRFLLQGLPSAPVTPQPSDDGRISVYPTTYYPAAPAVESDSALRVAFGETATVPPIRIRPVPAVRVSGAIANLPSPGAQIQLLLVPDHAGALVNENGFETARTVNDPSGTFTILGVPPGSYRLRASGIPSPAALARPPDGAASAAPAERPLYWVSEPVSVGARDVTLALTLRAPLRVSGRFIFEGTAPPPRPDQVLRDVVGLAPADGRQLIGERNGRDPGAAGGTFSITDVIGGSYVLRSLGAPAPWSLKSMTLNGQDVIDAPIDVTEDVTDVVVTFTDRPITVTGTVRTQTGALDSEAFVVLFPANPARWSRNGRTPIRLRNTRTTPLGTFRLPSVPPGDYFLAAFHDAAAMNALTPSFLEELSKLATRVRLDEGSTVSQELRRAEIK